MEEKFYTVEEIAKVWGLNPMTVCRWIQERKLGYVQLGQRARRIRQSDVDRFINARAVSADSERAA